MTSFAASDWDSPQRSIGLLRRGRDMILTYATVDVGNAAHRMARKQENMGKEMDRLTL